MAARERGSRPGSRLVGAAFALAVLGASLALFAPTGRYVDSEGRSGSTTLFGELRAGEEDAAVLAAVLFPVVVSALAVAALRTRLDALARWAAGALLFAFAILAGFSVGLFFMPAAVAMLAAAGRAGERASRGEPSAR